jgi:hypothetical protein
VALAGLSGFGGYSIGSKFAAENASQSSVTTQNAFSEKIKFSKPKLVI